MLSARRAYNACVVLDDGRGERAGDQRDLAGRVANRNPRELTIRLRRRELDCSSNLIEAQRTARERMVERRQDTQRAARRGDPQRRAVIATREPGKPRGARRAPRRAPITTIISVTRDLHDLVLDLRFLLEQRDQRVPTRDPAPLERLINRLFESLEHMFGDYPRPSPTNVPTLCRSAIAIARS